LNVTLEELLEAVEEARRIFLAVYGSDGLVVAYARVPKEEMRKAFRSPERVSYKARKGSTHNQRTAEYCIAWNEKDLFVR
jgi:hypothetical protein